jgi:hypothetical protein
MKISRTVVLSLLSVCSAGAISQQTDATATATPTPAPTPDQVVKVTAPTNVPDVVAAAARAAAKDIIARKKLNDPTAPPLQPFTTRAPKLVIYALAAVADPEKSKEVGFSPSYIAAVETHRTDKQVGSSAASGGSTSAADKPGIPYLLGLAIEHGGIAQNISGSTLTLTTSPYALVTTVAEHQDAAETYYKYRGLTRFAVSASYNLQDTNDPLASVRRQQLAEWAVKLRLFGDHSARSQQAHQLFVDKVLPALQDRANVLSGGLSDILTGVWSNADRAFKDQTRPKLQAYISDPKYDESKAEDDLTNIIIQGIQEQIYSQVAALGLTQSQQTRLSQFLADYKSATDAYVRAAGTLDEALKQLEKKATLTLGYFNERGASGTPNYSVGKLMFEKHPDGFMQIDANISASAYSNPDRTKNQQTFRDATAALQFQQNLGKSPFLINADDKSQISLAFAGRYERLQENRHVPGKKADIAVANWKVEIPIGQGVSLPISITYANSTELINEKDVRGNFGITFDLDKLHTLAAAK